MKDVTVVSQTHLTELQAGKWYPPHRM